MIKKHVENDQWTRGQQEHPFRKNRALGHNPVK